MIHSLWNEKEMSMKGQWWIAALLCVAALPAMAADYVWTGAVDSAWENPDNWVMRDGSAAGDFPRTLYDNAYINATEGNAAGHYSVGWVPEVVITDELAVGILKFGEGYASDARLTINNNITLNQFIPGAIHSSTDFQFTMGAYTMRLVTNGDSPVRWDANGAAAWGWDIVQSTLHFDGSGSFIPRYGAQYGDIIMTTSPSDVMRVEGGPFNEPVQPQGMGKTWDFGPGEVFMNGTLRTFGAIANSTGTVGGVLARGYGLTLSCWSQNLPSGVIGCAMWSDPWTGGGTYTLTGDLTVGLMDFRGMHSNGVALDTTSDGYELTLMTSLRLGGKVTLLAHDSTVTIEGGVAADDGNYGGVRGLVLYGENSKIIAGNATFDIYGSWDSSAADAGALSLGTSIINMLGEGTIALADGQLVFDLGFVSGSMYTLMSDVVSDGGRLILDGEHVSVDDLLAAGVVVLGNYNLYNFVDPIPEPATMSLLALGAVALLKRRRVR
jgi:hypothetical protein